MDIPHGTELAGIPLKAGEDAGPGPGARSIRICLDLVECARDMRCPSQTPGTGGQE